MFDARDLGRTRCVEFPWPYARCEESPRPCAMCWRKTFWGWLCVLSVEVVFGNARPSLHTRLGALCFAGEVQLGTECSVKTGLAALGQSLCDPGAWSVVQREGPPGIGSPEAMAALTTDQASSCPQRGQRLTTETRGEWVTRLEIAE